MERGISHLTNNLTIHYVSLRLKTPFKTSLGVEKVRKSLILDYQSNGIRAFSECAAFDIPYYSAEDNLTALHVITEYLAKYLNNEHGKDRGHPPSPEEFIRRASNIRGHNMAKAAVEMLLWDYFAKLEGKPLVRALGNSRGYADVGISLGMEEKQELLSKKVEMAVKRRYKRIKIKIQPGMDYDPVKSVRDRYPDVRLSIDANGGYSIKKDVSVLKKLDGLNLEYIEQPLEYDDLFDHATLAKEISTPICLDESITTPRIAEQALKIGAAKVVNIKLGRLGGLSNSLETARIVRENGGNVWVGGMLEMGIGRSFNIALASHELVNLPGDTSPNDEYFAKDIVSNPFVLENDGTIRANKGAGIGVDLDLDFLLSSSRSHPDIRLLT